MSNASRPPLHLVLVVLAILGALALAWSLGWIGEPVSISPIEAPASSRQADASDNAPAPPIHDGAATPSRRTVGAPDDERDPPAQDARPAQPVGTGYVALRAVRHADETPVLEFAWTILGSEGEEPKTGSTENGLAYVGVPLGTITALRVQAEGFAPTLPIDVSLLGGATTRTVVARLVPKVHGPCVSITVVDDLGRPVQDLLVTVERRSRTASGRAPWTRILRFDSSAADGVHAFSDLDPGHYKFHLVAVDPTGRPALLCPVTPMILFDGSTPTKASLTLEPAGTIELSVRGPRPGTFRGQGVTVRLFDSSGNPRPAAWRAVDGTPPGATPDSLPTAEVCELSEPLLPGTYEIRVSGPGLDERRPVTVCAGQRTSLTLP